MLLNNYDNNFCTCGWNQAKCVLYDSKSCRCAVGTAVYKR